MTDAIVGTPRATDGNLGVVVWLGCEGTMATSKGNKPTAKRMIIFFPFPLFWRIDNSFKVGGGSTLSFLPVFVFDFLSSSPPPSPVANRIAQSPSTFLLEHLRNWTILWGGCTIETLTL